MSISHVDESDRLGDPDPAEPAPFDVFLSYHGADATVVRSVARRLREHGVSAWFDKESLPSGNGWQHELSARLLDSRACAVFVGPHEILGWERAEMEVALDRSNRDHGFRVFAVLLPGIGHFDPSTLPPFLATRQWVDLRAGTESAEAIQSLVNAVHGVAPQVPVATVDVECPYRGLEVFEERHARFFFGRGAQVQRMLEGLRESRFLAVLGQSGVGKSSLVQAGLLPVLRGGAMDGSALWRVLLVRPGARPAESLAAQLVALQAGGGMQQTVDRIRSDERTLSHAATLALVDRPRGGRLLVVVDQFEEIFTLCRDPGERAAYLRNLLYAATVPHGDAMVVITLRADFYGQLAQYPAFAQLTQSHHLLLARLADRELQEIIQEPAYAVGMSVEQGLADTILADVVRTPGNLPLLEHALLETWRHRSGRELTLEGYRATGGVQHGLSMRAEAVYADLSDEGREQAKNLFLRLIQPGEGTEDTRRRAAMAEVVADDGAADVLQRFVAAALLTTSADKTGERWVEISHEAVITGWARLAAWVDEDRAGLLVYRRLITAARDWRRHGRSKDALLRGVPLEEATAWRARSSWRLNWLEQDFLAASQALDRAVRRRRRRRLTTAFAAITVIAMLAGVAAVIVGRQRNDARSRQLAAESANVLDVDPALGLTLALRAGDTASTAQADVALRQATAQSRGRSMVNAPGGPVYSVRFLPDGRAVTGSEDGALRLWDLATGTVEQTLPVHKGHVFAVRASPDGQTLASGGADRTVRLTSVATGASRVVLNLPDSATDVELSHSGRLLAATVGDGTVHVLDLATGRETPALRVGADMAYAAAFSADDRLLAATDMDGSVHVWRVSDMSPLRAFRVDSGAYGAEFGSTAPQLAVAGADGKVRLWDVLSGALLAEIPASSSEVYFARFSRDGQRLAVAGLNDVELAEPSGSVFAKLAGHAGAVLDVAFDPTGDRVVTAGLDGTLRTWDATDDPHLTTPVTTAEFDPAGTRIVSGSPDGRLREWRRSDLRLLLDVPDHAGYSQAVFSADGSRIISYGDDGVVKVRDAADGSLGATFEPNVGAIRTVAPDPTDGRIVIGGDAGRLVVVDAGGTLVAELSPSGSPVNAALFSPDGRSVVAGRDDGSLTRWGSDGRPSTIKPADFKAVYDVAFNADGSLLATADASGAVDLWRPDGGNVAMMPGHRGIAAAVRFSRDGLLVSTGPDGVVRVWDSRAAIQLVAFADTGRSASYVDLSPDGQTILKSVGPDGLRLIACDVCGSADAVRRIARSRDFHVLTPDEEQRYAPGG